MPSGIVARKVQPQKLTALPGGNLAVHCTNYQALDVIISPSVLRGILLRTLPNSRIDVIVNGVDDSRPLAEVSDEGYMLYFGRLSRERAWQRCWKRIKCRTARR